MNQYQLEAVIAAHDSMYNVAVYFGLMPRRLTEEETNLRITAIEAANALANVLAETTVGVRARRSERQNETFDTQQQPVHNNALNMSKISGRRLQNAKNPAGTGFQAVESSSLNKCYRTLPQNYKRYADEVGGKHVESHYSRPGTLRPSGTGSSMR